MFRDARLQERMPILSAHIKEMTEDDEMYYCDFCDDGWASEVEVQLHKTIHLKQLNKLISIGKPVCIVCIKKFKTQPELIGHVKTKHLLSSVDARKVEREIFVCDICSSLYFNKRMLVTHLKLHHFKNLIGPSGYVSCPVCEKKLNSMNAFRHIFHHQLCTIFSCPICFTNCKNNRELKLHTSNHHSLYLFCEMCMETFERQTNLNNHIKELHNEQPQENCDDYEKYFTRIDYKNNSYKLSLLKGLVVQHMIRICVLCREMCVNTKEMKRHIYNHKAKKAPVQKLAYACICGEEYAYNIFLKQHLLKCNGRPVTK